MSKKHLKEIFNQQHSKCRFCEQSQEDGVTDARIRCPRSKPLFHPRPWTNHPQCYRKRKNLNLISHRFRNMVEEIEELEIIRARFEEECRNAHRVHKTVRRLYKELESKTLRVQTYMSDLERGDVSEDMDTSEESQGSS